MKLVTSNKFKLQEFQRFGLNIQMEKGLDLEEVLGTPKEVVIYKAIEAGANLLVEDTILTIDGEEIVDIRERISEMDNFLGKEALWTVSLACVIDNQVLVASATIKGSIKPPQTNPEEAFGFDPYFYPSDNKDSLSLHSLELKGEKDNYSARKNAILNFINKTGNFEALSLDSIKPWTGKYQDITH